MGKCVLSVWFVLLRWREREERKGKGEEWFKRSTCSGNLDAGEDPWVNGLE